MKRLLLVGVLAAMLGSSTGCCVIDRLFHCPCGRWRGGGCCGDCDTCDTCGGGCVDGDCGYEDGPGPYYGSGPAYPSGGEFAQAGYAGPPRGQCDVRRPCGPLKGNRMMAEQGPPGPPIGQVAYPYYTTRGPRDFLARNPGDIGP